MDDPRSFAAHAGRLRAVRPHAMVEAVAIDPADIRRRLDGGVAGMADAVAMFGRVPAAGPATPPSRPVATPSPGRIASDRGGRACPPPGPDRFGPRRWGRTPNDRRADPR